jgi:hypothetical protein
MDPYIVQHLFAGRQDDLVREAEESRLAQSARETHEEARPASAPAPRGSRRFRIA